MTILNCPRCHQMFRRLGDRKVCPACQEQEEQAFAQVVDWLRDHPGATVGEASVATGVEERVILRLLREGRVTLLELVRREDQPTCRRCGAPVAAGQLCPPCARGLGEALREGAPPHAADQAVQRPHSSFRVRRDGPHPEN